MPQRGDPVLDVFPGKQSVCGLCQIRRIVTGEFSGGFSDRSPDIVAAEFFFLGGQKRGSVHIFPP